MAKEKVGLTVENAFINQTRTLHERKSFFGKKVPRPEKLKPVNRLARRAIKSGSKRKGKV